MDISFPKIEEKILKFWKENKIFEKSLEKGAKGRNFVFYEGPPTANGKPGIHHIESRAFKDIICRYKTMQGFRVERKAGWDTHGLPVELEVEKNLGLKSKKEIEEYGIDKFNKKCKESVWKYKMEWERLTERIAFWLDLENPYITYQTNYIETVWWLLKKIFQKGLLYKGYKVVHHCPRCGTSLSSHEVAMGYKTVTENSVYVRFKIISQNPKWQNTSILSWTTTPWTLPGNVALAVNPAIDYVRIPDPYQENQWLVLALETLKQLSKKQIFPKDYAIKKNQKVFKGSELLGLNYEPLFDVPRLKSDKSYKIYPASFVNIEEGTGVVHTAVMYGEEDYNLGKEVGLPAFHTVDEDGKFIKGLKEGLAGLYVKNKETETLLLDSLRKKSLLFFEELYRHEYPFCWRCASALLYYAKQSWFIDMQKAKKALILNNQKINWIPDHLKTGRFGEWLKDVKDWAISRERYWGTPLPFWQCQGCKHREIIGSLEDLLSQKFSDNNYYILRHGHSLRQVKNLPSCWPEKTPYPLTEKGRKEVLKSAKELKKEKIDLIFSSDLLRTKETSQIVAKETDAKIFFDKKLREYNIGDFNAKNPKLLWEFLEKSDNFLSAKPENGESLKDIAERMFGFLKSVNEKYKNKNILIVSHELPLTILEGMLKGRSLQKVLEERKLGEAGGLGTACWRKISFSDLPLNEAGELDLHRPYIDKIKFYCPECQELMERVSEVLDCWFDSGAMPFAQHHYPFEDKDLIDKKIQFPADYISEAIDQTRGWFYTLLAISTLLDLGPAYKNVISLGHVLDEKGEKMSKSKGNIVDPWHIIEKYGVDAVRWYFYTINQPGEPKLFSEKEIEMSLKRFIFTFWNSFLFFDTYKCDAGNFSQKKKIQSKNLLDKWVISKLNGLIKTVSERLDKYEVVFSARLIEDFLVNDLSQWYIRRSRKRFHLNQDRTEGFSRRDFEEASSTLGFSLLETSKLCAPFIPFLSEEIFQKIGEKDSVHLAVWPKADKSLIDKNLEKEMEEAREIVSLALAERTKSGIKVRQPLSKLKIKNAKEKIRPLLLELIKEEVNVKKVIFDAKIKKEIELDIEITQELRVEGITREIVRNIQEMRKQAGLKPKDRISVWFFGPYELNKNFEKNKKSFLRDARVQELTLARNNEERFDAERELAIDGQKIYLSIKSV